MGFSDSGRLNNMNNRKLLRKRKFLQGDKHVIHEYLNEIDQNQTLNESKKPTIMLKKTPLIKRLWDWLK